MFFLCFKFNIELFSISANEQICLLQSNSPKKSMKMTEQTVGLERKLEYNLIVKTVESDNI